MNIVDAFMQHIGAVKIPSGTAKPESSSRTLQHGKASGITPRPEVLEILHRLRFQRFMVLERDLPRHRHTCAWCGGPKPRARKYCSHKCSQEAFIRSNSMAVCNALWKRDKGKCAGCGHTFRRAFLESDHILPVCEGGGVCGLENYRTLCHDCHRAETRALHRRRAEARKTEKYGPALPGFAL